MTNRSSDEQHAEKPPEGFEDKVTVVCMEPADLLKSPDAGFRSAYIDGGKLSKAFSPRT